MASRLPCESSIGSVFHSLQATSQALQPMQTEVSVKKPTRAGWSSSYPAWPATSGTGPYSRFSGSWPVKAGLAELIDVTPGSSPSRRSRAAVPDLGDALDRAAVGTDPAGLHPGPLPVRLDEVQQRRAPRPRTGLDVAGSGFRLLDVHVRVEHG